MRSLAVGRYRFLTTNRRAVWIVLVSVGGTLLFAMMISLSGAVMYSAPPLAYLETVIRRGDAAVAISIGGRVVGFCYVFQIGMLATVCHAFGSRNRRSDALGAADLMDTAPITPAARFWGDAMGVFASTMAVHVATLPLLAFVFALSPFPSSWMVGAELVIVLFVAFESFGASWKLHTSRDKSPTARTAGANAVLVILVFIAFRMLTSWSEFRDALAVFLVWPSPRSWFAIKATFLSPALLAFVLLMIFAGFTFFYYTRAVRAMERG